MRIYVPVSLRRRVRGPQQGNLIAQMASRSPSASPIPDRGCDRSPPRPPDRKARTRTSLGTLFGGRIARRLLLKAVIRQRVNVTSASIPGPEVPLYLAGAQVLEVFPVLPLIANEPLGVGALSYAGTFSIGVVADRDAYPDLDVFAAGVARGAARPWRVDPSDPRPDLLWSRRRPCPRRPSRSSIRSEVTYERRRS